MERSDFEAETAVPDGETPARCRYCGRPFASERLRALHLGETHSEACTDDERTRYEDARVEERRALFAFRIAVVLTLLVTYLAFTYLYAFAWS